MVIKVINLDKCISKFGDISGIDLMPEIKESARKVQRSAKEIAPKDTGDLARSIHVKHYPSQQSSVVYTTLDYAPHQEFGFTVRKKDGTKVAVPAQPYMRPAMNMHRAGITQSMKKYLREQLRKKAN